MKKIIAYQGEKGAYSESAALHFFGTNVDLNPCRDFESVFKFVGKKDNQYGVIPIENSLTGSLHENIDFLLTHKVKIIGEVKLRVSHSLIALPGTKLSDIDAIYSHPQAIAQCGEYIKKLTGVKALSTYDTAGAVKMIKEKKLKTAGAIASIQAAKDYKMKILAKSIESNKANYTRFVVLGKKHNEKVSKPKTSIVFGAKNIQGALFKCLAVFAMRDIDLLKIESRPIHGKPWAYMFYLDFRGNYLGEIEKKALNHLKELTFFIKILGSYSESKEVSPRSR